LLHNFVGGLGFASSGNIGDDYAVFEPTHGSAPKYAGMYKVNPIAMILTVKLVLYWLGEKNWRINWKMLWQPWLKKVKLEPMIWVEKTLL